MSKRMVPDKPGWWWRWDKEGWRMIEVVDIAGRLEYADAIDPDYYHLVVDDDIFSPVLPPKWTPKEK